MGIAAAASAVVDVVGSAISSVGAFAASTAGEIGGAISGIGGISSAVPGIGGVAGAAGGAASSIPGWLPYLSIGSSLVGGGLQAEGQLQSAKAESATAEYNSQVAAQNAQIAGENVNLVGASGTAQVEQQELKNKATYGALVAAQGASGVDVNTGSAKQVQLSQKEVGQLDAMTIQSQAARQAFGYQTQETGFKAESILGKSEAQYAKDAGDIAAGSTLLGSFSSAGINYGKYLASGGFS